MVTQPASTPAAHWTLNIQHPLSVLYKPLMARHHPDNHLSPIRHKHLAAALLSFIAYHIENIILMANKAGVQRGPSTLWNDAETIALIDGLFARRAQQADSGNFRDPVYSAVARETAPHHTEGSPVKSTQSVRNKWQLVCPHPSFITD